MNKADLVRDVEQVVGSKKEAQMAVDRVFESIIQALKRDDAIKVTGFGTFKVDRRKARKGRNPQTGEEIYIEAKKVPKFVPAKALKDALV